MMKNAQAIKMIITFLLIVLGGNNSLLSQEKTVSEYCQKLIVLGSDAVNDGNLAKGMEYFSEAETLAEKHQWHDKLLYIKNYIAKIYHDKGNYGIAIGYSLEALEIAKYCKDPENETVFIMVNIGTFYLNDNDIDSAISYYKRAIEYAQKRNWDYGLVIASVNISNAYNVLNKPLESVKYLKAIEHRPKKKPFDVLWKINYAESMMLIGELNKAQEIANSLLGKVPGELKGTLLELLSKIYSRQGKDDLAIEYARSGLENSEVKMRINLYEHLSDLYFKRNNYVVAFRYKDSAVIARDSMAAMIKRDLFESSKVKQKIWEYQKESENNRERLSAERRLFYTILIAFLAVVIVVILFLRQKKLAAEHNKQVIALELEKEMNENLLLEKEIKEKETNALLEQERLKSEIEARNRKISAKALFLSDRNRLIDDILQSIANIPELVNNSFLNDKIRTLKSYLKNDNEWDDFIAHFEEVNPGFLHQLKSVHPSLSANDMRFIAYTYMNLSVKEISGLLNITIEACKKRKERIVSKMNLSSDVSLYDYLSMF